MMPQASYTGLEALLTPDESVLVLIDHQPFQFANLHSHEPQSIVANVVALAKGAKAFGVPTILSTVLAERGGHLIKGLVGGELLHGWRSAMDQEHAKLMGDYLPFAGNIYASFAAAKGQK